MAEMTARIRTGIVPYLVVDDAPREIDFLTQALGGDLQDRLEDRDGKVMNARVMIGLSLVMISSKFGAMPAMTGMLFIFLPDVDAAYARAVAFDGVQAMQPVSDQFWGDRCGSLRTANGVTYWLATHKEDLTRDQIAQRLGMQTSLGMQTGTGIG